MTTVKFYLISFCCDLKWVLIFFCTFPARRVLKQTLELRVLRGLQSALELAEDKAERGAFQRLARVTSSWPAPSQS